MSTPAEYGSAPMRLNVSSPLSPRASRALMPPVCNWVVTDPLVGFKIWIVSAGPLTLKMSLSFVP